jgi:hypothetical protein
MLSAVKLKVVMPSVMAPRLEKHSSFALVSVSKAEKVL